MLHKWGGRDNGIGTKHKGKARNLSLDAKREEQSTGVSYMSGAAGMLPPMFDV